MTHEAMALHPSLPKGRKSGKIKISDNEIEFYDGDEQLFSLPINEITITQGGTGNRYVYFSHHNKKDLTIYTDDKKVLNYHAIRHDNDQKKSVSKIKNNRRLLWFTVYSFVGLLVAIVILFYMFRGAIVESVAQSVPVTWEQEISKSMLESALVGKNVLEDEEIVQQLQEITEPLVNAVENKGFKFSFTIIEDETLNAYALPGGAIVIHSGLILKATHANEVAGVLAHEISHVTRRHHVRGMVDKIGFFVLFRALLGDMGGIGGQLAVIGTSLESLKYSRDYELEADDSGWELILRANLNPEGMIAFFEKLQHDQGNMELPDVASFLSTHPATAERISKLKSKKQPESYIAIDIDFEKFQDDIEKYIESDLE